MHDTENSSGRNNLSDVLQKSFDDAQLCCPPNNPGMHHDVSSFVVGQSFYMKTDY